MPGLAGTSVLIPRTPSQARGMVKRLKTLGAIPMVVPTIQIVPPENPEELRAAARRMADGDYTWTVLTSTNAVNALCAASDGLSAFAHTRVAAVGEKTAVALTMAGVTVDLIAPPDAQNARGLVEVFPAPRASESNNVFLPRADIATDVLPKGLEAMGWTPHHVDAYRTVLAEAPSADVREAVTTGRVGAICFTSASTVRNLIELVGMPHPDTVIACIGPMAAQAAREAGLEVHVMPQQASADALIEALDAYTRKGN